MPKCIWGSIEVFKDPLASDDPFGTIMFALAVVILSNLLSNVPLILMMRPMLSELARKDEHEAQAVWLMVAFLCESHQDVVNCVCVLLWQQYIGYDELARADLRRVSNFVLDLSDNGWKSCPHRQRG